MLAGVLVGDWLSSGVGFDAVAASYQHAVAAVGLAGRAAGVTVELSQSSEPGYHPGRCAQVKVQGTVIGSVGEVDPAIAKALHLPRQIAIFEIDLDSLYAKFPGVVTASELRVMPAATQDLSLVVADSVPAADLASVITQGAGELLESVTLVDDYRGQGIEAGKKSLTYSLVFRASDRTLTQAEASEARDQAVALANQKFDAEMRG